MGKLLTTVVEFVVADGREAAYAEFMGALGDDLFAPFMRPLKLERDVSSWFIAALGHVLGQKRMYGKELAALDEQRVKYVAAVCGMLAGVTADSVFAHNPTDSTAAASTAVPAPALGYIPTVAAIATDMPQQGSTTASDEQLTRVLAGLSVFLAVEDNRFLFCKISPSIGSHGPSVLAGLLDKDVGLPVQVYYQTVFCLWLLSFASQQGTSSTITNCVSQALEEAGVPRRLTNVLREVGAEKVVRISLSTLRNIMKMSVALRKEMIGAGLVGALESLCFRRWNDEDIREDLGVLAEALESELASMSNFDVYRAEVLSGALEWTPPHRDEMFWRENVEKLERNNLEVLRCMVRLLNESSDNTVLSVACHDLAQFVKHHPRGRLIAQSLGVKTRLMELMASGEGDVRRYALSSVQVLMLRGAATTAAY